MQQRRLTTFDRLGLEFDLFTNETQPDGFGLKINAKYYM